MHQCSKRFALCYFYVCSRACSAKVGHKLYLFAIVELGIILLVKLSCSYYTKCYVPAHFALCTKGLVKLTLNVLFRLRQRQFFERFHPISFRRRKKFQFSNMPFIHFSMSQPYFLSVYKLFKTYETALPPC